MLGAWKIHVTLAFVNHAALPPGPFGGPGPAWPGRQPGAPGAAHGGTLMSAEPVLSSHPPAPVSVPDAYGQPVQVGDEVFVRLRVRAVRTGSGEPFLACETAVPVPGRGWGTRLALRAAQVFAPPGGGRVSGERGNDAYAVAFGEGCDARLAGRPVGACPYASDTARGVAWRAGWQDVHAWYASEAKRATWRLRPVGDPR